MALVRGSLYKRGHVWWVQYPNPVRGALPRQLRASTGMTDRRAAERRAEQMIERAELRAAGFNVPEDGAQLAALAADYATWLEQPPRSRTKQHVREVRSVLTRFLKASSATVPEDLTRERAEAFLAAFRGRTYNKYRARLRAWGRWLLEVRRAAPWHPFAGLAPIAQPVLRRRRALSPEEEARLLATAPWIRRVIYRLMLTTGLRRGEVDRLEWRDLGLRKQLLVVRAESSKARREEELPLTAGVVALLEQLLELRRGGVPNAAADPELVAELRRRHAAGQRCEALGRDLRVRKVARADGTCWWWRHVREVLETAPREVPPTERVFAGPPREGSARLGRGARRTLFALELDLVQAGVARKTDEGVVDYHSLRYTFATRLRQRAVHPTTMQRLMRHSDPRLTHGTYQSWDVDELRRAIEG